jgi:hypothetical protein
LQLTFDLPRDQGKCCENWNHAQSRQVINIGWVDGIITFHPRFHAFHAKIIFYLQAVPSPSILPDLFKISAYG